MQQSASDQQVASLPIFINVSGWSGPSNKTNINVKFLELLQCRKCSVLFDKNSITLRYCESLVNVSNFMIMSYLNHQIGRAVIVISGVDKADLSWHGAQLKYIGFQWLFILLVCLSGSARIVPVRNIRNSSKVGMSPGLSSFLILSFINCWTTPKVIHSLDSVLYSLLSLS